MPSVKNVKYDQLDSNFAEEIISFALYVWAQFLMNKLLCSFMLKRKIFEWLFVGYKRPSSAKNLIENKNQRFVSFLFNS